MPSELLEIIIFGVFLFLVDVKKTQFCEQEINEERYQGFVYAVKNHYWYQMYIDDLPIWGEKLIFYVLIHIICFFFACNL